MVREVDAGREGGGDPTEDHQGVGHPAGCLNRQRLAQYRASRTGSVLVADAAERTADIDFWWPFEPQRSSRDSPPTRQDARLSNDWTQIQPPTRPTIRCVSSACQTGHEEWSARTMKPNQAPRRWLKHLEGAEMCKPVSCPRGSPRLSYLVQQKRISKTDRFRDFYGARRRI